jgi:uncharacterized protein
MSTSGSVDEVLGGLQIIDADCHMGEAADVWTSRAPAALLDRVPTVREVNGEKYWFVDGRPWTGALGGNTIGAGRTKVLGMLSLPSDQIDPSSYSVADRLALMDQQGVRAEVIYPNSIGFASNAMFGIEDVAFRNIVNGIYNDYFVDIQRESNDRLMPQALLPIWDMDLTVREMARLAESGIRGFTVTDKPHMVGLPDLDHEYFAPMWSLANEIGTVMNFHIGSGSPPPVDPTTSGSVVSTRQSDLYWESFGPQRRLAILATQFYMSNVRIIVNLCMSDMFDKYPNVQVVSAESGVGWVPFVLEAMEYQLDEMVTTPEEKKLQSRRPREMFASNVSVMTWFEKSAFRVLDDVGVDNVMVMTDIPHPTCLFPRSREHFAEVTAALDADTRRKVLQDNAARVYRVDLTS